MNNDILHIILADDDEDDRLFFKDAIDEIKIKTAVTIVKDGAQLMDHLNNCTTQLPDLVFLDLNMPSKNGMECLKEIRGNNKLKDISVAIYSTSASEEDIEETFVKGANVYIRKPNNFPELKKALAQVLSVNWHYHTSGLNKENFLLSV